MNESAVLKGCGFEPARSGPSRGVKSMGCEGSSVSDFDTSTLCRIDSTGILDVVGGALGFVAAANRVCPFSSQVLPLRYLASCRNSLPRYSPNSRPDCDHLQATASPAPTALPSSSAGPSRRSGQLATHLGCSPGRSRKSQASRDCGRLTAKPSRSTHWGAGSTCFAEVCTS